MPKTKKDAVEKSNLYKTIFNNAGDAMFIHGMNGSFLEFNEAACGKLDYFREELLKIGPKDIDAPEYAAQVKGKIKQLQKEGETNMETAHVTKRGKRVPVELSSKVVNYKREKAILSIARDVSARNKLKWAKKRRRRILKNEKREAEFGFTGHCYAENG
ncbi:MAG: PAS domain S-box protein [Candidatus Moraniibacteriota bacterium]